MGKYLSHIQRRSAPAASSCRHTREYPVTVHVTIGADIIHNHPSVSPADIGAGSHRDFRLLASLVAGLNGGGVYLNCVQQ